VNRLDDTLYLQDRSWDPTSECFVELNFKRGEKMRAKTTIVSSLLCALLVLTFALSVQANVTYQVQTSPLNAVKNGVAEVMGDVSLTVNASPINSGIANNDQITITYSQSAITPSQAATNVASVAGVATLPNGIVVSATANFPAFTVTVTPSVPSIGGTVTIRWTAPVAAGVLVAGTDTVTVAGVRSSVVGRAISSIVITQFTAAPSGSSSFIVTSSPTVAFVVDNFSISGNPIVRVPICQPSGSLAFTVKEESLTTWVQYVAIAGVLAPTDGRAVGVLRAGANANSWVYFVYNGLPTGVKAAWPASVLSNQFIDPANTLKSALTLVSQSTSGDNALYSFTTPSQAGSDNTVETFTFNWTFNNSSSPAGGQIGVGLSTPPNAIMSLQAQEQPPEASPFTALPRFNDPLRAAFDVVQYVDCVTNLLFPWVGSLPDFGYDTGIAVANTGYDVGAISPPTVGDPGVIRFYFYPQTFGAAPVAPTPVTTAVIVPGDTYAFPFSSFGAQKFGYLIAVCDFRFGHGFAYITQGTIGGTLDTAQGYLALVLNTSGTSTARFYPESLGE
jgi:hypothetical protein